MKLHKSSWLFVVVAGALAVAGCGATPGTGEPIDMATAAKGDMLKPSGDMGGGCKSDTDCKGTTPACDPMSMKCVPCVEDKHCAMGETCVAKACKPGDAPDMTGASGDMPPATDDMPPATDDMPPMMGCQKDDDCKMGGMTGACCNKVCVDVTGDSANCGACGNACAMGSKCCASVCADIQADSKNCGSCGVTCNPQNGVGGCAAGKCTLSMCKGGFGDCDKVPDNGCEVDLNTDAMNCLACGSTCAIANGKGGCSMGCTVGMCDVGFADCDKDAKNGCEVSTLADAKNCGGCGMGCGMVMNGLPKCDTGKCTVDMCNAGFGDCDMDPMNGCETNTGSDAKNCGKCAMACPQPMGGTASCAMGVCGSKCTAPLADCNMNVMDGCEVDTSNSPAHCGGCGKACLAPPNATATCAIGACGFTCKAGFADCDKMAANGCEVSTDTDVNNCKTCATKCPTPMNATPTCVAGVCGVGACGGAFKDCNANVADGCETNTNTSILHCAFCNMKCAVPANGNAACVAAVCGLGSCNVPFGNCDNMAANGCEINLSTDAKNCGACAKVCATPANATPACANSTCGIDTCTVGFADCANGAADGCEVNTTNNVNNCGACGTKCVTPNGTAGCAASKCTVACNANFANCDMNVANGCEVSTRDDAKNCGACAMVCPAVANGTPGCAFAQCTIGSCNKPFLSCDNNNANGCETNTSNNANNCGGCGIVCPTGVCANGVCRDKIAIVHADTAGLAADVRAKLVNSGAFTAVDLIDARAATPTLATLKGYQAVLVYSNFAFLNSTTLGDNLADYFDGGGRVVVATFGNTFGASQANANYRVEGRWASGNYRLLTVAALSNTAEAGALQIPEPQSPLAAGVTTLTATNAFRSTGAVINSGVRVVNWGSGAPLIVRGAKAVTVNNVTTTRHYTELNFFPPSSTVDARFWKGSGNVILKNALLYKGVCHYIVGKNAAVCPSGAREFCDGVPISPTSPVQAKLACDRCYGAVCTDPAPAPDCAGRGFGPAVRAAADAVFGYEVGCSGGAGRIWSQGTSFVTYGTWAN
ncbi:MAG: hypothetical protein EXR72_10545 [Myxococcales bacterium]|nr:hypothetical protein [Myxococcales bacterium]